LELTNNIFVFIVIIKLFNNLAEINIFIILFKIIKIINNFLFNFYKINYYKFGFIIFKNNKIMVIIEFFNWNRVYYIQVNKCYKIFF